jgi:hypothetical protein
LLLLLGGKAKCCAYSNLQMHVVGAPIAASSRCFRECARRALIGFCVNPRSNFLSLGLEALVGPVGMREKVPQPAESVYPVRFGSSLFDASRLLLSMRLGHACLSIRLSRLGGSVTLATHWHVYFWYVDRMGGICVLLP